MTTSWDNADIAGILHVSIALPWAKSHPSCTRKSVVLSYHSSVLQWCKIYDKTFALSLGKMVSVTAHA